MNDEHDYYRARSAREEAEFRSKQVAAERASLALHGVRDPEMDEAAEMLVSVLIRAGAIEAKTQPDPEPVVAAMERLDPTEFARRRQARLRMDALRKKGGKS